MSTDNNERQPRRFTAYEIEHDGDVNEVLDAAKRAGAVSAQCIATDFDGEESARFEVVLPVTLGVTAFREALEAEGAILA